MNNQLQELIQRIREGNISHQEALKQFKLLETEQFKKKRPSSPKNDHDSERSELAPITGTNVLYAQLHAVLLQIIANLMKVPSEVIDSEIEFKEYGFDQVTLTEFINEINREYQLELTPAVLFHSNTLQSITSYLAAQYYDVLMERFQAEESSLVPVEEKGRTAPMVQDDVLQEKAVNYFKKVLSSVIKLPVEKIEADAPMEKYGIDSIMVMQLTNQLEKTFGSLSKTLFFEYQTLKELTGYFLQSYCDKLIENLGIENKTSALIEEVKPGVPEPVIPVISHQRKSRFGNIATSVVPVITKNNDMSLDIAIIGLSGRYPQAHNIHEFWKNLRDGKDCITEIPKERWDHSLYFDVDKNKPGKTYTKWGGFLEDVDKFDPLFFNISPKEAEIMEPQERLFLECVYETLEDAGYTRENLAKQHDLGLEGNVGVYVGVMYEEYQLHAAQEQLQGNPVTVSGSPSNISNRVSYFCNFHGPSIALDTMCSSSLTAIHLACQSLQQGGCELAIAGGVNVSVHPNKYLMLAQGKFASSKGLCESFGEGGDGYVPGEGVGAVLLKPLSKAIADGDHIYGVIKGTAVNHGGKTNGYTVPNPNAQAEMIGKALKVAGFNPRTISYIEAHGTGTSLGDPIEITGLTKAFREYTQDKQFCAIGSAKSNIGHCESAAGIAGVTKVLLQLQYGQLVPSIHSEILNPNIDFNNTPFIVQQSLTEWKRPAINGQQIPRRAGISSFGAGGSNAHVVIEEYIPKEQSQSSAKSHLNEAYIILLSAKNEDRLQEQARRLLRAILEQQFSDNDLSRIAYTLQIGREALEERFALIVSSIEELAHKLQGFLEGQEGIEGLYRGQAKRNQTTLGVLINDEEMQEAIVKWIQRKKYGKLVDLWVKGLVFDWNRLYGNPKPQRISLPTYPFARERYWIPEILSKSKNNTLHSPLNTAIHPLLHRNTSDLLQQRFSSTFSGEEFFIEDYVLEGHQALPGIAGLEMARAAIKAVTSFENIGSLSDNARTNQMKRIRLKNVIWGRPIIIRDQQFQLHIGLFPENNGFLAGDGEIGYEIYGLPYKGDKSAEPVIYCQGKAVLAENDEVPKLDLRSIQAQCNESCSAAEIYQTFQMMGLAYGPGYQGIERIYLGREQVLAKLSLPVSIVNSSDSFVLHPSMIEASVQALASLSIGEGKNKIFAKNKPLLPMTMQEVDIFNGCTASMWAYINYNENKAEDQFQGNGLLKFNIDICDDTGKICVRIKGYSPRILQAETGISTTWNQSIAATGSLLLKPIWKEQLISHVVPQLEYERHLVVLCGLDEVSLEIIENGLQGISPVSQCIHLHSKLKRMDQKFQADAIQLFEEIQSILKNKPSGKVLVQILISAEQSYLFKGLGGLLKTAQLENPKLIGQMIELDSPETKNILTKLRENSQSPDDQHICYREGKRLVSGWSAVGYTRKTNGIPWKDGGIYLITGGAGGLGFIFAKEIAGQVKNGKIILTGRSELDRKKQMQIKELQDLGATVEYRAVDVADKKAVTGLIQSIKEEFGGIHGILHSAGVIQDNYLIHKTTTEWQKVFAPKVSGLINLDESSQDLNLVFFIVFSSMAGSFGNPGQADYSTANAFMDAYTGYRNQLVASNQRYGQTVSMNWPLWKDGGMQIDSQSEKVMFKNTGMTPMRTQTGIRALYLAFASGEDQVVAMEGNLLKLKAHFLENGDNSHLDLAKKENITIPPEELHEKILHQLKAIFGEVTKLAISRIDDTEPLESYGIDSVMIMQLNSKLEANFGEVSKTIFYEYQNLNALAEYLTKEYPQESVKWVGLNSSPEKIPLQPGADSQIEADFPVLTSLKINRKQTYGTGPSITEPVAIIGISGRYPKANTLDDYWYNLASGRDCISEIPEQRWPVDGFYHPDKQEAISQGKSYCKWGGFIEGFADFDPLFFNISPREAFNIDPQERIFIQSCWEVLEDAGYTRDKLAKEHQGRVGVFAGITKTGFDLYGPELAKQGEAIIPYTSFSSLANRVSYLLNLHGPSIPVDTMCSASLTAVHEACEHLHRGECEMAIAGGVNLYLHPTSYIGLCAQQMLSIDGQCKSFGQGGNGFVPGEGVGAVLLKPLSRAIDDQDHIYAIIRGTSINHGGKTNGYTVPNPIAQGELVRAALEKAGVNARTVSYIEAHGTGTELGDPIEITGLTQGFHKDTKDNGYCAIGSVKSNIGHLEAAAGIAGLTKIVLQMQHGQIVPSLHAQELNPNINFRKTPFTVQQQLEEWKRPVIEINGIIKEIPRIAGISSFGAGGANAHVVIEEYMPQKPERTPSNTIFDHYIILLSARDEERLKAQAQQLLVSINRQPLMDHNLDDIAYTLQVGREAMEERLALIVGSKKELQEKLQGFLEGGAGISDVFRGQVKRNKEALMVFAADEDLQKAIESWIVKGKYGKLLDLWVKGLIFDNWQKLYGDNIPKRISLPTYPFAKETYWLPKTFWNSVNRKLGSNSGLNITSILHPLVQQNTSDLSEQRFSSVFTGAEFFLADHIIKGQRVMPGVAYLEMARAAIETAAGVVNDDSVSIQLKNVVWARPIVIKDQPVQVHIGIYPEENGEITYEIYGLTDVTEDLIYSQGRALLHPLLEIPTLDLNNLQARCSKNTISPVQIYDTFKRMGIQYGPGHQGIEQVLVGDDQVMAKLSLPVSVMNTKNQYVLHPSILDGAFQAALSLMINAADTNNLAALKPCLPFALDELEIFGKCTSPMWAYIRAAETESKAIDKLQKLDLDLCDESGKVFARMKGYSSRVLEGEVHSTENQITAELAIFQPDWQEQPADLEVQAPDYSQQIIFLCEFDSFSELEIQGIFTTEMQGIAHEIRCVNLQAKSSEITKRFESYIVQVFTEIQKILKNKSAAPTLIQIVIANQGEKQLFEGFSGLLKTAHLENPKLIGQLIEVEANETLTGIVGKLKENSYCQTSQQIRYQVGKRYIAGWKKVELQNTEEATLWKDGGIYLITGGAGGLGLILANEITDQIQNVVLILTGRAPLSEEKRIQLKRIEEKGARIGYKQVDVSDKQAVSNLIQYITEEFGGLQGIIHSAGINKDNFIIKKTQTEFLEVLAPKVSGVLNLDKATQALRLDFFILFSAMAGSLGNPGQSDYAAANAFMDAFAGYRNSLVDSKERYGRTLAMNWPLWQAGGMQVDIETENMLRQDIGLIPLRTRTGIQALYQAIRSGKDQVMVAEGNIEKFQAQAVKLSNLNKDLNLTANLALKTVSVKEDWLEEKAANYFKMLLSSVIKLPAQRIDADAPMEKYGIDSIMVMQLTNQLEKTFGSLPKTLFFEYQTIREITEYFLKSYRNQLIDNLGIEEKVAVKSEKVTEEIPEPVIQSPSRRRLSRFGSFQSPVKGQKIEGALDIAIIGVSGRYPQAGNLHEFWENLQNGKDCITEIPKERWDHSLYFDADKNNSGKTYTKWGGFLEGVDQFDPLFFNISPREAEIMDPQERLFLECVYATLEDAGYTREALSKHQKLGLEGNVGVYVGVMYEEYQLHGAQEQTQGRLIALPGNPSSIANRVSYYCNFHGPSMAIDTMCSSSLTAIHLACQCLQHGGCELAIAGGVNVSIHPNKYLILGQGKFASSKGRCESFGEGGEGYVPGEGVGAVLLKPLSKAITDGDQIYGVIKGTAVNHGGKTNGFTVPNPNAQSEVIGRALKEAGINPRTISYIEAHGTGTILGDPIEIAALTKTFTEYTNDKQFCAIGSAKSNIGHCESAAGIAGITKVLLQMKHQQLAPSLHSKILNPNIDFQNTPFIVQQELAEWKQMEIETNGKVEKCPRRAGISSFGAGGSNAHIIIEEYIPKIQNRILPAIAAQNPVIIILSAKNEIRLKEQAQQLLHAIQTWQFFDASLGDIAYTLQVGREAMEERLAMLVSSLKDLQEKLQLFIEGQDSTEIYRGQVKGNRETLQVFTSDEELQEALQKWLKRRKYEKLLELWVKGLHFDWNQLYGDTQPRRISLPTYPFAKEQYWATSDGIKFGAISQVPSFSIIHPLLHQNTSDLMEQRYSTTLTGKEFFLADHVVKNQRILPGVAYLEMARVAVEQGVGIKSNTPIQLKNVVWARPIQVGEDPVQVHIGLYPETNGEIAYEIYSNTGSDEVEPVIHSQGHAILTSGIQPSVINISAIQLQCNRKTISATEMYENYQLMGINYGPGQKGVQELYVGTGQVLAKLSLPKTVSNSKKQFILHPSLMDGALQASIGLAHGSIEPNQKLVLQPALPFALQELIIYSSCEAQMWAWIRINKDHKSAGQLQKLDIDICDESGRSCVQLKGLTSRILGDELNTTDSVDHGTLMFEPVWKDQAVIKQTTESYKDFQHLVLLIEPRNIDPETIEARLEGTRCLSFQSKQKGITARFQSYVGQIFETIQDLINDKSQRKIFIQLLIFQSEELKLFTGLTGLLKTAQLENPKIIGQLIEVETTADTAKIIQSINENSRNLGENWIRYQEGRRQVSEWKEITPPSTEKIPWKDGGIYLITGGSGGLGQIFVKEIAETVKNTILILTGRSLITKDKLNRLKEMEAFGVTIDYRQTDLTKKKAVESLIQNIRDEYGHLDGIIHSAGIIKDNYIIKKSKEEFQEVLAPKVNGLVYLDEAAKDLDLDFFILFSSISGSFGNPGQADYSTANAFMNAYAGYRNHLVSLNQRQGRTIAVSWPLWKEGGMHINQATIKILEETTGLTALQTRNGIQALYQGFVSEREHYLVMAGNLSRIRQALLLEAKLVPKSELKPLASINGDTLQEKTIQYFKISLSGILKLPVDRIEADAPFEKYGIDSVMVMQLTNQLEKTFGSLSKTLFFEYQTIQELTGYFLESYRDQLIRLLGVGEKTEEVEEKDSILTETGQSIVRRSRFATALSAESSVALDIAIIGVSGSYPQARTLRDYWKNLRDGIDCITEIPKERWDHSRYFDPDKSKSGKTYSKWGGFLEGVDQFDPLFFNISPLEAEYMDPQERLFLECVYGTLEDAGYTRENLGMEQNSVVDGNVGVYVGVMYEEYQLYGAQEQIFGRPVALGGNSSSIANRVSYWFNFHGPSISMDTMCSSSLTAIHYACQDLRRGECELAIAGGVNVSIHPNKYLALGQGKFVSSKGRCESFGEGGDGYVPGEGVGALLLKPLAKAIADGDQIYGVIKGSAINHGGKTNGYTVPNPNAQAKVIGKALKEAGIDPRTLSYIEAHGTGTSLGDPIEITGLTKAFREYTQDNQFCAIGSAKSNIGHCESAAGIAGVTKVLLQLKYGQLAPSLHSEVLNPNIDFGNTPFMVQKELIEWKRPIIDDVEFSRRAGVSSFGAGGSNAHIVIEEYMPNKEQLPVGNQHEQMIIVLSAKDEERLRQKAQQMLIEMKEEQYSDRDLANIAYTLQVGREAMEERLAVILGTINELEEKLQNYVDGNERNPDIYHGQVKRKQDSLSFLNTDEDLQKTVETWIGKQKYQKLADLWVKGLSFNWTKLYDNFKPRRISLPTYPFAKDRYWLPEANQVRKTEIKSDLLIASNVSSFGERNLLHPLVHQNTSDFSEQRFSSTFDGKEFFLADHIVQGHKIMPGVAYLEMVRAAVMMATGNPTNKDLAAGRMKIKLEDVVWMRPIVVNDQPIQIDIGLYPDRDSGANTNEITFEIYSNPYNTPNLENDSEPVIYSQGRASLHLNTESLSLNLSQIKAQCKLETLAAAEVYKMFRELGIDYGPSYQGIETVYRGEGQILAKLSLPVPIEDNINQFVLHPGILDAALQSTIALKLDGRNHKPALAFALDELEVLQKCTENMWALARFNHHHSDGAFQKLDIDLCDEQGQICIRFKGYTTRVLEGLNQAGESKSKLRELNQPLIGNVMLIPIWDEISNTTHQITPNSSKSVAIAGDIKPHFTILQKYYPNAKVLELGSADTINTITKKLETIGPVDDIFWMVPDNLLQSIVSDALIEDQNRGVFLLFRMIKALLGLGYGERDLVLNIITFGTQSIHKNEIINPTHAGILGLLGTLSKEYSNWKIRGVDLEANITLDRNRQLEEILRLPLDSQGEAFVYRNGEWYRQRLVPFHKPVVGQTLFKTGGVYVVIGGAGGIGEVWSEYMLNTYQAQMVWIGRREKDTHIQAKINKLATLGPEPYYITADATDPQALQEAYREIKGRFPHIHGVVHSAVGVMDQSLVNMSEEQFRAGIASKMNISVNIAKVFAKEPLDLVLFFSSMVSFSKDHGKSSYAAGCTFNDAFAHQMALEWSCAVKVINWGYWGDVGIGGAVPKAFKNRLELSGIGNIDPAEAMATLEILLAGPIDQIGLINTTKPLNIEEAQPEQELVTVNPAEHSSKIQDIKKYTPIPNELKAAL